MSAYIVSHKHINAIIQWASARKVTNIPGHEQALAEMLLAENTRSVNYRYTEQTPVEPIVFAFSAPTLTPVAVLKACRSLSYQSCETEDWDFTPACRLLREIENRAIDALPGYEQAAWSIK